MTWKEIHVLFCKKWYGWDEWQIIIWINIIQNMFIQECATKCYLNIKKHYIRETTSCIHLNMQTPLARLH